jgi:hypothetical protein
VLFWWLLHRRQQQHAPTLHDEEPVYPCCSRARAARSRPGGCLLCMACLQGSSGSSPVGMRVVWAPLGDLGVCESGDVGDVELLEFNGGAPAHGAVASLSVVEAVVGAVAPIRGRRGQPGRPRGRPDKLHLDKADDDPRCRRALRRRGITPRIARRGIQPRDQLGRHRDVVEGSLAWLVAPGGCGNATSGPPTSCWGSRTWPAG